MDRLRDPGGCPWDREQTYESLRRYLLEETYEVADALDRRDAVALREELGDLLLQIVFLARLAKEQGRFTIEDVAQGITDKLIRRHPHIFGAGEAETAAQVARRWEQIKQREKDERGAGLGSRLDGIPRALPALLKAGLLGERARQVGFDWERPDGVLDKLEEELGELREAVTAGDERAVRDELGDLLFSVVMLARQTMVDAEAALERTNRKFQLRFSWMEQELHRRGLDFGEANSGLLEELWRLAKAEEPARRGD